MSWGGVSVRTLRLLADMTVAVRGPLPPSSREPLKASHSGGAGPGPAKALAEAVLSLAEALVTRAGR